MSWYDSRRVKGVAAYFYFEARLWETEHSDAKMKKILMLKQFVVNAKYEIINNNLLFWKRQLELEINLSKNAICNLISDFLLTSSTFLTGPVPIINDSK